MKGLHFFVTLPVLAENETVHNKAVAKKIYDNSPKNKINILHIEDDPDVLKITQMLLEPEANVVSAKSLSEAKNMLNDRDYDLVILDFALPDGHGASLLPIVNLETKQLTPVIVFSSYELGEHLRQYVSAGLIKSLTSNELLASTVRKLVGHQDFLHCKEENEEA